MIDDKSFEKAINGLLKNQIINQRETLEYVLLTDNGVSVNTAIENHIKSKNIKFKCCDILEQNYNLGFATPREYNDKFSMFRYFKKIYMEATTFIELKNAKQLLLEYPCDGLIINILDYDNSKREAVLEKIETFKETPNIVICVSKLPFTSYDLLKRSVAISQLKEENKSDSDYLRELEIFEEDNKHRIRTVIDDLLATQANKVNFIIVTGKLKSRTICRLAENFLKFVDNFII